MSKVTELVTKPLRSLFGQEAPDTSKQEAAIAEQRKKEDARLAEEKSDLEKRKSLSSRGLGGRSLLIATSTRGVTKSKLGD